MREDLAPAHHDADPRLIRTSSCETREVPCGAGCPSPSSLRARLRGRLRDRLSALLGRRCDRVLSADVASAALDEARVACARCGSPACACRTIGRTARST